MLDLDLLFLHICSPSIPFLIYAAIHLWVVLSSTPCSFAIALCVLPSLFSSTACALRYSFLSFVSFVNDFSPFLCPMVSFSVGVLKMVPVVPDMYKALSIHKIRQNTKMPTFYKTLYLLILKTKMRYIMRGFLLDRLGNHTG